MSSRNCDVCGAPYAADATSCRHCGNVRREADDRVVRQAVVRVLSEDQNGNGIPDALEEARKHRAPPPPPAPAAAPAKASSGGGCGCLIILVLFVLFPVLVWRSCKGKGDDMTVGAIVVTPNPKVAPPAAPKAPPPVMPKGTWASALAFDGDRTFFTTIETPTDGTFGVLVDGNADFRPRWVTKVRQGARPRVIVNNGIVLVDDESIMLLDRATGERVIYAVASDKLNPNFAPCVWGPEVTVRTQTGRAITLYTHTRTVDHASTWPQQCSAGIPAASVCPSADSAATCTKKQDPLTGGYTARAKLAVTRQLITVADHPSKAPLVIADPSPTTKGWKQLIGARAGLELVDMSAETVVTALPDAFAASSVDTGARRWTIEKTGRAERVLLRGGRAYLGWAGHLVVVDQLSGGVLFRLGD